VNLTFTTNGHNTNFVSEKLTLVTCYWKLQFRPVDKTCLKPVISWRAVRYEVSASCYVTYF